MLLTNNSLLGLLLSCVVSSHIIPIEDRILRDRITLMNVDAVQRVLTDIGALVVQRDCFVHMELIQRHKHFLHLTRLIRLVANTSMLT